MKEIKNYLHLYLGCECLYYNQGFAFTPLTKNLKSVSISKENTVAHFSDYDDSNISKVGWVKPILRSLNDMTEEERFFMNIGNNTKNSSIQETLEAMTPAEFIYLLSKHFDLFNLIPEGLAIDAKTLTK